MRRRSSYNRPMASVTRQRSQEALKRALDELKKSESKLRQVIDTIPALAWCNLPDGSNEFLNKRWHEYTGLSPEESRGWGWQTAIHPEDRDPLLEKWRRLLVIGEPGEMEARLRRHDGVFRWFLMRVEPLRDETGKIIRWYGTCTDIQALKETEAKLREDERELRRITDVIPHAIVVQNSSGTPVYANLTTLDYTGLSALFLLGLMSQYLFAEKAKAGSWLASVLYSVTPNWQLFWLADALDTGKTLYYWGYVGKALGYAVCYIGAALAVAVMLFEDRELS